MDDRDLLTEAFCILREHGPLTTSNLEIRLRLKKIPCSGASLDRVLSQASDWGMVERTAKPRCARTHGWLFKTDVFPPSASPEPEVEVQAEPADPFTAVMDELRAMRKELGHIREFMAGTYRNTKGMPLFDALAERAGKTLHQVGANGQ